MVIAVLLQLDLRVADARLVLAQQLAVFVVYHIGEVARARCADGFLLIARWMMQALLSGLNRSRAFSCGVCAPMEKTVNHRANRPNHCRRPDGQRQHGNRHIHH
jgi:hypothetical protein